MWQDGDSVLNRPISNDVLHMITEALIEGSYRQILRTQPQQHTLSLVSCQQTYSQLLAMGHHPLVRLRVTPEKQAGAPQLVDLTPDKHWPADIPAVPKLAMLEFFLHNYSRQPT